MATVNNSDQTTVRMIEAYRQTGMPTMFFTGMFQTPQRNMHTSQDVEIDIVRSDEDISIVVTDISSGYRYNQDDLYTNKRFRPPIHREAAPINAFDLLNRRPGEDPFFSPNFQASASMKAFDVMRKIENKIRRSIELQASQVLQTGRATLTDMAGTALYEIDYSPKTSHFPTTSNAWGTANADPFNDIDSLAEVIRNDGLSDPDMLIMGSDAFEAFIQDSEVRDRLDNRRIEMGRIVPMQRMGNGGTFRGTIEIGNYSYDIYSYGGRYKNPMSRNKVEYMDRSKVVVRDSNGRLDGTFGAIPRIVPPESRVLPFIPDRISDVEGGMDMFANAWVTPDGEQLIVGVGSRPLMIPTAVDTFGCLETSVS